MPTPAPPPTPKGPFTQVLPWSLTMVPEHSPPSDHLPACPLPQVSFPGEHQACSSLRPASPCGLLSQMVTGQASSEPSSQAHMPPMTVLLIDLLYFLPESESVLGAALGLLTKWRHGPNSLSLSRRHGPRMKELGLVILTFFLLLG